MSDHISAEETAIVSRNRVTECVRSMLHIAVNVSRRFTVQQLSEQSGVKLRAIRSYMANDETELREPPLSAALSIAVVLGPQQVNQILALIGYGGAKPLTEADELNPMMIVANIMQPFNDIVQAASDGRIDHGEAPACRSAADKIIATVLPLSSVGDAA